MRLSVIIPYYNTGRWVGKTLDSLLDQGVEADDYEIIVVDDGSDEDPTTLKESAGWFSNIHYYRIDHSGLSPVGLHVDSFSVLYSPI